MDNDLLISTSESQVKSPLIKPYMSDKHEYNEDILSSEIDSKPLDFGSNKSKELLNSTTESVEINDRGKISTVEEACGLARNWLPPITLDDKMTVMNALTGTESTFGTPLLRKYIEMLRPYTEILGISGKGKKPREADCVASGIVFFYGCLFYIMHFSGWGAHIEDIFLYNLLYILVDHYIDDIRIDSSLKDQAISQMFILIRDPLSYKSLPLIDPVLKTIALVYHRLITRCPSAKEPIITLFKAEIEGLSIQKTPSLDRNKYYDIALRKGGHTMQVLQYIVGNTNPTINDASFHIGTIMQLIDDVIDSAHDKSNNINTIATHDFENKGSLDELWIDIMERIGSIDSRFTIFKILYTIFAVYVPDRLPDRFSHNLKSATNPINLFDCNGAGLLVEAIMSELTAMELLEQTK